MEVCPDLVKPQIENLGKIWFLFYLCPKYRSMLETTENVLQGIPIIYYGTEQAYSGCNDPLNRESLYPNFNTNHHLYQVTFFFHYLLNIY